MASSLELNKTLAAILTAGIVASGAGVMSRILYHPVAPEEPAYVIEVAATEEGADGGGGEEAPPIGVRLASADAGAGETAAKKCASCHSFDEGGGNKVGPALYGVLGRDIGTVDGFSYSSAMAGHGGQWDYASLDAFLASPKGYVDGTKMNFAGVGSADQRADLILYLRSLAADPMALPEAEAAPEEEQAAADEAPADDGAAAEDAPTEQAAADEAPADEGTATEEAPTEQADAEEAAPEEEQAAAEEAPADEGAATEDAPTEQADAEEAAPEESAASGEDTTEVADAAGTAAESGGEAEAAGGGTGLAALLASGDPAEGENVSKQCKACHAFEPDRNRIGPSLWGVVGRDLASAEGFNKYSAALKDHGGAWDYETLDAFLAAPKDYIDGTKMNFRGVTDEQKRADLILYLRSLSDDPVPLPEGG
jgi:cytochrome c2